MPEGELPQATPARAVCDSRHRAGRRSDAERPCRVADAPPPGEVIAWRTGACAPVDNALEVVPPEEDDDNELTDAVRMAMEKDPLVDATQLRIGTAGGIVHLDGWMPNDEQREAAVEDAWLMPGTPTSWTASGSRHPDSGVRLSEDLE